MSGSRRNYGLSMAFAFAYIIGFLSSFQVAAAQEKFLRFAPVEPSKLHIKGGSNVHNWGLDATRVNGFLELNESLFATPFTKPAQDKLDARAEFSIPVKHLTSDLSPPMFTKRLDQEILHRLLKTEVHSNIVFQLTRLIRVEKSEPESSAILFQSTGNLVAGGVTNQVSFPVRFNREQQDSLTLSGSLTLKLLDFGIVPPSIKGEDSVVKVKVDDSVECSFALVLERN